MARQHPVSAKEQLQQVRLTVLSSVRWRRKIYAMCQERLVVQGREESLGLRGRLGSEWALVSSLSVGSVCLYSSTVERGCLIDIILQWRLANQSQCGPLYSGSAVR